MVSAIDLADTHGASPATSALRAKLPDLLRAPPERPEFVPLPDAKGLAQ